MIKVFNDKIAITPEELPEEKLTSFVTPDESNDRPKAGTVVMIGDLVTKVEPGQKIAFNQAALIGPYEIDDKTIWLIPQKDIYYEF